MHTNPVEIILMISTGFVAFVLLLSGSTKFRRTSQILDTMTALGVPRFLQRRWVAAAVPLWELGLGLALLALPGLGLAGVAVLAAGTFIVFTVFVIGVLRRGDAVDCGCFGELSVDDQISGFTVLRNVVLIVASGAVAITAGAHDAFIVALFNTSSTTLLVSALAWAVLALYVLAVSTIRLRRRLGRPLDRVSSTLPAATQEGEAIPSAELVSQEGVTVPLNALGQGSPVLLVFLSAECSKCAAVASRLPEWQEQIAPMHLRVATSSRPDQLRERVPDALPFAYFGARAANRALGAEGLPAAVLLGGADHPYVSSPVVHREEGIDALVRGIVAAQRSAAQA